jgi:hypothetical protein
MILGKLYTFPENMQDNKVGDVKNIVIIFSLFIDSSINK